MSAAVSQADFARLCGFARSYVTALKKSDRLALDADGKVLVEESRRRIAETADPNRDDVRARHSAARSENPAVNQPKPEETGSDPEATSGNHDYQKARAQKEYYLAEQARIQFERDIGKLVEKADVEAANIDVVTVFRQVMENFSDRTAPELFGKDLDAIRAILKQEVNGALADMERELSKRLKQMGSDE